MTIDKNNWFIREDSLTEEQYVEVCKYLVENCTGGEYGHKIQRTYNECFQKNPRWDFVGVLRGHYTSLDSKDMLRYFVVITYQQFLEHIKGVVSTANSTPDTPSENLWIDWEGGERPVDPNTTVEVMLDNGYTLEGLAKNYGWNHSGHPNYAIIKYRILLDAIMDTNPVTPVLCENPSQGLTDTLEWMFELGVERVEADSERITITHKHIGKIVMDVKVDFKVIKSMFEGLKDN